MMMKTNQTELLITEVEKHPCLWNIANAEYMNKGMREEAWDRISSKLTLDYDNLNQEEKLYLCEENKKKWTNVRDSYRKCLFKSVNNKSLRPYVYEQFLGFLKPILLSSHSKLKFDESCDVSFKQHSEPESPDENEDSEPAVYAKSESEDNIERDEKGRNNRKTLRRDGPARKRRKKYKNKLSVDNNMQFVNVLEHTTEADFNYEDDDSQFLLSFRNDLKKMSRPEKTKFKLAMTQLIQSISISGSGYFNAELNYQDEDSQFLLSFRNDLQGMSASEKLKFKLDMTQIVLDITESRSNILKNNYTDEDSQYLLSLRNDLRAMSKTEKLKFKRCMIELIQSIAEGSSRKIYAESVDNISFSFET